MFEVGDKIVHPAHGAGVIVALEQKDLVDEFHRYYVIELAAQEMRLMVPVRMADEIGLRRVASREQAEGILAILGSGPEMLPDDFKERQALLLERLRIGDTESLARVVRDMAARSLEKSYSPTEARLYDQARAMLGGELALARDTAVDAALTAIDEQTGATRHSSAD
jgi:CarD family transcriptional regulator